MKVISRGRAEPRRHECRKPGLMERRLRRLDPEAIVECEVCNKRYRLNRHGQWITTMKGEI